jgi:MoxR-like ATPase
MMSTNTNATISSLLAVRSELQLEVIGGEDAIDALLCGLVSGHSVILFGPRGTGKTTLVDALVRHTEGSYFGTALHPFKEPSELFGAIDIPALQKGRYRLNLSRMSEAHIAFLDETSRASDATLESLFDALEKRRVENEGTYHKMPLWFCIGAANSEFQGDRLGPLRDRFPIALYVEYVENNSQEQLMELYLNRPSIPTYTILSIDAVEELRSLVKTVVLDSSIKSEYLKFVNKLRDEGIGLSDRRWLNGLDVLRAYALINGRTQVELHDFKILKNVFWDYQEEQTILLDALADIGNIWPEFLAHVKSAESLWYTLLKNDLDELSSILNVKVEDTVQACIYVQRKLREIVNTLEDLQPKLKSSDTSEASTKIETVNQVIREVQEKLMEAINN